MASSGTPRATVIPIGSTFLTLLLLSSALASALFFPQSELTLRLPYLLRDKGKSDLELTLLSLRTLKNDSTDATRESEYAIASTGERVASYEPETREIVLHSLPEKNESRAIIVRAKRRGSDEEAILEIDVRPIGTSGDRINCTDYVQDMCFWNVSKYRVYENRPVTMLGKMGPRVYRRLCPAFRITRYELLNGTDYFHTVNEEIYSNASLDRDSLEYPGGPGPRARVKVRCVVWNENTGNQHVVESHIDIDVLDEDDNPPIAQTNSSLRIYLRDFTVGDRLDDNDLMVKDADSTASNRYVVRILGDTHDALNITYDALPIEHPKLPDNPASTAIFTRIYSRTTLLPKSPYTVVLRVTDESLVSGHGEKSVDITLSFVGPRHHSTATTTSAPLDKPISYPSVIKIARTSTIYSRLVQPSFRPNQAVTFAITDSEIFNVTRKGGIVYVANHTLLQTAPSKIIITIRWRSSEHRQFESPLTINLVNVSVVVDDNNNNNNNRSRGCNGRNDTSILHSCANAVTRKECESMCGIASGTIHDNKNRSGGCSWRSNSGNNAAIMTERYKTCSPDLSYCPDYACDDLEHLDHRICPQDCTIESEVHFAEMNKRGRGILSGLGTCSCNDMMQCICGPVSFRRGNEAEDGNSIYSENGGKDSRDVSKTKRQRERESVVSDARKAASNGASCGPTCMIGAVSASFFLLTVIVGAFAIWRYRYATKDSHRECKHRSNDGTNALGILPSDYLDRGDGRLIGLESFTGLNRSLLLPKASPPDPKWEFPRSRLTIEQVLGEGEFGRVLRAKAIDIGGWPGATTVAVKTLKEDASNSELADLLSEYQLLKEAQHPNVIRLLGACTLPGATVYLIIEFAEFGSLRNYLRRSRHLESEGRVPCSTSLLSASPGNNRSDDFPSNDPPTVNYAITPRDILSFAWQISKGMAYLTEIKLVHRDLAARNVLLATGKVCKISDFGLTRDVYEDDAYLKRSKGRVPVKWMAPESLADHVYTSKSDVWSFGVLLWELVTLGASPYPGVDVHNLYNLLKAGYRMERPANCSTQLYKLMVSCWHDEPGMRPSFKELTGHWERMLEDGVEYLDLNPRTVHNQAYFASLHALDSPIGTSNEGTISGNLNVVRNEAFNYLRKDSSEPPISKCDKVDKLQALWQDPIASFPIVDGDNGTTDRVTVDDGPNGGYVNDPTANFNVNHWESPIEATMDSSVTITTGENNCNLKKVRTSHERQNEASNRPQSYVDMTARKILNDDLLLFNNVDRVDRDHDGKSNETKE